MPNHRRTADIYNTYPLLASLRWWLDHEKEMVWAPMIPRANDRPHTGTTAADDFMEY